MDFSSITETHGQLVYPRQIAFMVTRYSFASQFVQNKDVLEIACGEGQGLDLLSETAKSITAGDLCPEWIEICKKKYRDNKNINLSVFDAQELPFKDNSFDVAIIFGAIYFIPDQESVLKEMNRVLRKGGILVLSTINPEWHNFNPYPFASKYNNVEEMKILLNKNNFTNIQSFTAFKDEIKGNEITSFFRHIAIRYKLIPTNKFFKSVFKRIFYGKLIPLPEMITKNNEIIEPVIEVTSETDLRIFIKLYFTATKE